MPTIEVRTDVLSILGVATLCLLIGAAGTWLLMRRRRSPSDPLNVGEGEGLYIVFSRLSHRLKTVGEVIRGQMHGFTEELPNDPERWRVARRAIGEESAEISGLTVVRLGMTGQPLVMEPVNVPRLLENLMVDLGPAADAKGLLLGGIVSNSGQDIPHISADPLALKEVFSNLMENAIKHNGAGTEVTAEVKREASKLVVRM